MRIIFDIIMADNYVDTREKLFYDVLIEDLAIEEFNKEDVRNRNSLLALLDIRNFSDIQKHEFAKLMGQMIVIDNNIHYNEVAMYNVVREFCQINVDFDDSFDSENYPNITYTEYIPE